MADYTIQLRTIVEIYSQEMENFHELTIDQLIDNARPKIFDFQFPFYDVSFIDDWKTRWIKHFYMREIGAETIRLWKLNLEVKLNTIMPAYNKLYEQFLSIENLNDNRNITEQYIKENAGTGTTTGNSSATGRNKRLFQDTPQSAVDLDSSSYVTDITQTDTTDSQETTANQSTENKETYIRTRKGQESYQTNADLLKKASKSLVFIDQMIYDECEDLFMMIY